MPIDFYPIPLSATIKECLLRIIREENQNNPPGHPTCMAFFPLLVSAGCDFYELLSLYSEIEPFTEEELETLIDLSPNPCQKLSITKSHIRECIPRWTATKFHTTSIADAVELVYAALTNHAVGIKVLNSNLNPKNLKAVNDRYILLTGKSQSLFLIYSEDKPHCLKEKLKGNGGNKDDPDCLMR